MKYHILRKDKSFLISCDIKFDRDDILEFFKEKYPDVNFISFDEVYS